MKTITVTTKTGTEFELTVSHRDVDATAKGINLGGMKLVHEGFIEAYFPTEINGKLIKVGAEFDAGEWVKVKEAFDCLEAIRAEINAANAEYERSYNRTITTD